MISHSLCHHRRRIILALSVVIAFILLAKVNTKNSLIGKNHFFSPDTSIIGDSRQTVRSSFNVTTANLPNYWEETNEQSGKWLCSRLIAGPEVPGVYPQIKQKTIFIGPKFVFVLGIEGTGHHFLHYLLKNCSTCVQVPKIKDLYFASKYSRKGLFGSTIHHDDARTVIEAFLKHKQELEELQGKTVFINTLGNHWVDGQGSYPNFSGPCRHYQLFDVRLMADIFESLGFDFRIVILLRDAVEILVSATIHRNFGKWQPTAKLYLDILKEQVIEKQLKRVDKKFFHCLNYDLLPEISPNLGSFLGVDSNDFRLVDAAKASYRESKPNPRHDREREMEKEKDTQGLYLKFDKAMNELRRFCED